MDELDETSLFRLKVIKDHLSQSRLATNRAAKTKPNHEFVYTRSDGKLTQEQREFYEKNGFVVIPNLISAVKLEKYRKRFQEICAHKINVPMMTVMKDVAIVKSEFSDGEKAISKIQDFCEDDELFEYCCLPEVVDYIKSFTGPNVMAMHTMLINKPPGSNTFIKFHEPNLTTTPFLFKCFEISNLIQIQAR